MPAISDDIFFATLTELNAKLRAKEFSCEELTRAFCDRLEKLGPRYNALALSFREQAMRKAKDVDGDIGRGRFRGVLQGVPFGVKDLIAVKGHPTTWGAQPYASQVFEDDATVIKKLDKTGAVLIGKLSMVELAGGGGYRFPAASMQGPGINPWDRSRWSGGSSSGSGSAVAAGLVTYALGSETSGSILTPSAFCGVTGLRPTYGVVSRSGAMALSWTLDKIGPMCRSAEDCGFVLHELSGKDKNDPSSVGGFHFAPQFARKPKDIRVGFAPADFDQVADEAARPAFKQALEVIRSLGVQVKEAALPDFPYGALTGTIIAAEASSIFEELVSSGKVNQLADARQIAGLKASQEVLAKDYLKAMRIRTLVQEAFRKLFIDIDILVAPARYNVASRLNEPLDRPVSSTPTPAAPVARGMPGLIPAGNLAGLPALSLPCGFAGNLPVGIQLVGRPLTENMLLAVGVEFQKRTDWHRKRPAV
jgi:aspartyl-tRNA(Asn)/glutamyl-tRNA(Gln) amidotransferase subunit A